jgi:hypothetical protein
MWQDTADDRDTDKVKDEYMALRVIARKACSLVEDLAVSDT